MNGAREYSKLFKKTHQEGKLYFVVSSHARGRTFRVYVIPSGEDAIRNGSSNPPLNHDAVEVYGVISGQCGWTECYGWTHKGKWQDDFNKYVKHLEADKDKEEKYWEKKRKERQDKEANSLQNKLDSY